MQVRGKHAWKPANRIRHVSQALRAYAAMTTSADTGRSEMSVRWNKHNLFKH